MGQHFLYHSDLIPATAVHHAVYAKLTNDLQHDLIVCGPNWLKVYRIEPYSAAPHEDPSDPRSRISEADQIPPQNANVFHLIDSFALAGVAESLHVLSFDLTLLTPSKFAMNPRKARKRRKKQMDDENRSDSDSEANEAVSCRSTESSTNINCGKHVLLLTFALYKWVMIGYDRKTSSLVTLSIFTFEENAVGFGATLQGEKEGREQLLGSSVRPLVRIDSQVRCGAMLVYLDQIVIVPFRDSRVTDLAFLSEDEEDEQYANSDGGDKSLRKKSGEDGNGYSKDNTSPYESAATDVEDDEDDVIDKQSSFPTQGKSDREKITKREKDIVSNKLEISLDKSVKLGMKRSSQGGSKLLRGSVADSGLPSGMKDLPYSLTGREFLLRLRELDIKGRIADFAFLDGYLEPTLMILHEENERIASSGRFAIGYDTMCLTVLSITLNSRLHPVIWCVKNLSADCFRIIPCKVPIGGALLLSTNAILYFNQTQFYGFKLNVFADKTVNQSLFPCQDATYEVLEPLPDASEPPAPGRLAFIEKPLSILLYECHYDYLGSSDILLSLPDDSLYVLKMPQASNRVFSVEECNHTGKFILRKVASPASTASCLLVNRENDSIFIGSRCGDSVLYAAHRQKVNARKTLSGTVVMSDGSISGTSNVRGADTDNEAALAEKLQALGSTIVLDATDEDDAFLYGPTLLQELIGRAIPSSDCFSFNSIKQDDHSLHLQAIDYIPGIGQITSMDLGVQSNSDSNEQHEELVVSGGSSKDGSISVIHQGLRPIVSTAAELSGCRAMWTVVGMSSDVPESQATRRYDSYLILSVAQRTMILRTGEEMEPLEDDSGFYTCGPTLCATNLFSQRRIVQVFKQGVRVMQQASIATSEAKEDDEGTRDVPLTRLVCTQEIPFAGDIESGGMNVDTASVGIVSVDTIDPYILLLLTDGSIRLLEGDEDLELTVLEPTVSYDDGNPLGVRRTEDTNNHAIVISAACLFYDWAGMFEDTARQAEDSDDESPDDHMQEKKDEESHYFEGKDDTDAGTEEDDDEMAELYQTATKKLSERDSVSYQKESKTLEGGKSVSIPIRKQREAKLMCGLCYGDGSLHVYSVPDFRKMGIFPYVTFAPKFLVNTMASEAREARRASYGYGDTARQRISKGGPRLGFSAIPADTNEGRIRKAHAINSPVADIAIHRIGPSESQHNSQLFSHMVLLVFLANGDLIMYKVLPSIPSPRDGIRPSFHFVRVNENLITRPNLPMKAIKDSGNAGTHDENSLGSTEASTSAIIAKLRANFRYPMLTRFFNVNNNSGMFFRGAYPVWILPNQGQPVFVPLNIAAAPGDPTRRTTFKVPVLSFTPFHHWNCPNGFVYFHSSGSLRVCELPSSQNSTLLPSSNGFVLQKVRFGATIHHLLYLGRHGPGGVAEALKSPTFAMVLSRKVTPSEAEQAYSSENNDENADDTMYQNGVGKEAEDGDDPNAEDLNSNVMAPTAEKFPDLNVNDMPLIEEDAYELRVVQLDEYGDWAGQGVFRAYFERHEVVLSVKVLYLHDASLLKKNIDSATDEYHRRNMETDSTANEEAEWNRRKRPYIVIGTGYVGPNGEDASGKGRLLLYEVDYAQYVDKDGTTSSKLPKLRLTFIKEHHQGAITSVIQLGMYVLASVGSKMIVYEFKSDQLIGCAFYDAQMFITSLSVLRKEYVMYSDVYKSISFLRWRQKDRQLILLAKDYEPLAVTTAEFNILDTRLALIAADVEENLHVLQYAPHDIESRGGQRLLRTSDFHVGVQISSILRKLVFSNASHQQHIPPKARSFGNMYLNVLGSSEGGIAALIPVPERVFRRLFTLQNVMISALPQNCALNPREFRVMKANGRVRSGRADAWCKQKWKKGFLDGQVLCRFLHMDYVAQKELARCIGTNPEVIIQNLSELQRNTMSFL